MSKLPKGTFYCLPNAARRDPRLSGADHRVLGAITFFDRGGANGRGCYATQATLAREATCDASTVKRSIQRLAEFGYLLVGKSEKDGRSNTLHVIYDNEIGGETAPNPTTGKGAKSPSISTEKEAKLPSNSGEIGGNDFCNSVQNQGVTAYKEILLNNEGNAVETASPLAMSEINAAEAAPIASGKSAPTRFSETLNEDDKTGQTILSVWDNGPFTALLDREVSAGRLFSREIADKLYERLETIHDDYEFGDPIGGRAYRLLNTDICRDWGAA